MKNVLYISSYPDIHCGIAKYTSYLLSNFKKNSINISCYQLNFRKKPFLYVLKIIMLILDLINAKYSIIHLQYTPTLLGPFISIYIIFAKIFRKKVIITFHERISEYIDRLPLFAYWLMLQNEMLIIYFSNLIIFLSNSQRNTYSNLLKNKQIKFTIIPQGINKYNTKISRYSFVKKFSYLTNFKILSFFGILRRGKGIEILIDAFKQLVKTKEDICLLIVGKPIDTKYFNFLMRKLKKTSKYFILGFLSDREMRFLLSKSYVTILPYNKNTNSAVLMDAISTETPIIGSSVGSIEEYIKQYHIGEVFQSGNYLDLSKKIGYMLNNITKIQFYKNNEKKLKKKYTWKFVCDCHFKLYQIL